MTYYQTYITEELTKEKALVKDLKKEVSQLKKDLSSAKKMYDKCDDINALGDLAETVQTLDLLIESKSSKLKISQYKVLQLDKMKRLRYAKLSNGLIVETSRLDQFKKRFAKYRMSYEYKETDEGLEVSYSKDGVKGKLTLFVCPYEFPDFVTFPQID